MEEWYLDKNNQVLKAWYNRMNVFFWYNINGCPFISINHLFCKISLFGIILKIVYQKYVIKRRSWNIRETKTGHLL